MLLTINNLYKQYKNNPNNALSNINLTVSKGELIILIGHNGSGKSTLFNILTHFTKQTSGDIKFNIPTNQIGFCPQRDIINWNLTFKQNIKMVSEFRLGKNITDNEIKHITDILNINHLLPKIAEYSSGGELKRCQIARAIVGRPELIILDEPTIGLDPDGIHALFTYLKNSVETYNTTVILSTHETSRFIEYCTRVIALNKGKLIFDDNINNFLNVNPNSKDLWEIYKTLAQNNTDNKEST